MEWLVDLLNVIKSSYRFIEMDNFQKIKKNVEKIIHSIVVYKDRVLIDTFIILYSLGKVIERIEIKNKKEIENIKPLLLKKFRLMVELLEKNNINGYYQVLRSLLDIIYRLENLYGEYLEFIIEKAKVRLGYLMYRHGISINLIKALLNIPLPKLLDYIGKTESYKDTITIEEVSKRINYIKEILE